MHDVSGQPTDETITFMARALRSELKHRAPVFEPGAQQLKDTRYRILELLQTIGTSENGASELPDVRRLRREWGRKAPEFAWRIRYAEEHESQCRLYRLLRLLRVEIVELRETVARVREGACPIDDLLALTSAAAGDGDGAHAHATAERAGARTQSIDDVLTEAEQLVEHDRDLRDYSDEIRHLRFHALQIETAIATLHETDVATSAPDAHHAALERIDALCRETLFFLGWRTIPERLKHWLDETWAGSYIPFHQAFEDEVPDRAVRDRILRLLVTQPGRIMGGIVDLERGLIFKYSTNRVWQVLSAVGLVLLFLGVSVVAIYAPTILHKLGGSTAEKGSTEWGGMLFALPYWAVFIGGVVFHAAVEAFKRDKASGPPLIETVMAAHPVRWMNARFWHLALRIVMFLVGFVGALALFSDQATTGKVVGTFTITMFLVGYGLDSFVGIFSASVEKRSANLAASARQQLSIPSGS